jgi:hypothetical protein
MFSGSGLIALLLALSAAAPAPQSRKALVVGIDRYDGSPAAKRPMRPLRGAVQDAKAMAAVLKDRFHFEVQVLADGEATRAGILSAIQSYLVEGTAPGDLRVLYFSGHGGQVVNTASPELDKLDETIVPFDGPAGSTDIRDKELAPALGEVIRRGGVLTVLLDSCHSGSATRGPPEQRRFPGEAKVAPLDPRDVADPSQPVPLELRGALVLSASQDLESALEVDIPNVGRRGAFTFALVAALADPDAAREPARRLFNRARQQMELLTSQQPVIAGSLQRQRSSLFDAGPPAITAAVEVPVTRNGDRLEVGAGSTLGLGVNSVLAPKAGALRLVITSVEGPSTSLARVRDGNPADVGNGGLFRVVQWAAAPGANLLVAVDGALSDGDLKRAVKLLRGLRERKGVEWIEDPEDRRRTHWLEADPDHRGVWCLYGPDGKGTPLDEAALGGWVPPAGVPVRLFAAVPPPANLAERLRTAWSRPTGLVQLAAPRPKPDSSDKRRCLRASARAAYSLVGRLSGGEAAYAWHRSAAIAEATAGAAPAVTDFWSIATEQGGTAAAADMLRTTGERLARVFGWLTLRSPAESDAKFPYRLVLRRTDGEERGEGAKVRKGEVYGLALRADPESLKRGVQRRWIYVFTMDSFGARQLLYPRGELGDVENFLPIPGAPAPAEIPLVERLFRISPPYGTDTFFLLASDKKLPDPFVLNEEGVRTRGVKGPGDEDALPVDLLAPVMYRGAALDVQPADWTLRRVAITSEEGT